MAVASSGRPGRGRGAGAGSHAAALSGLSQNIASQSIANLLTLARLACTVPLVVLVTSGYPVAAFYLFVVAALSDGVDGYIAKRFNGCSALGAILDPAADKLLLAAVFGALAMIDAVPLWLVATIVARDLLIVGGAILLRWRVRGFRIEPLIIGKVCTFAQLLLAGLVLGHLAGIADLGWLIGPLQMAVAAVTLLSAAAYLTAALRLGAATDIAT